MRENAYACGGVFPVAEGKKNARSNMKHITRNRAGSEAQYGPRLAGALLHNYLENSDDDLAIAYREHAADAASAAYDDAEEEEEEDSCLFGDFFPDTHLDVDLKVISRTPGRMQVGANINCMLTRDSEFHFTAMETASEMKQAAERRNPVVFQGTCINVHRKADGTIYPTFNRPLFTDFYTFRDFCSEAAEELRLVSGLGGESD